MAPGCWFLDGELDWMKAGIPILIVEDDAHLGRTLVMVLQRGGFDAHLAPDGRSALLRLQQHDYAGLLLDLNMPGMGGLDLLPTLRRAYPNLPVLILTADASSESAQTAFNHGVSGYLLKPFDPRELVERLSAALRSEKLRHQRSELHRELRDLLTDLKPQD